MSTILKSYVLPADPSFVREGEYWTIEYEGITSRLRHSKGLRYVAELLTRSEADVAAIDLASEGALDRGETRSGAIELLDADARAAYKARLSDLEEVILEAEAWNDGARVRRAREEREAIARELQSAIGLGGRVRTLSGPSERARQSTTKAIKSALARITAAHPQLGRHLSSTIRTGLYCSYRPDPRVPLSWRVRC